MSDLRQTPAPGERRVRFVGDTLRFSLRRAGNQPWPAGWRAFLRTNLGHAAAARAEIIAAVETGRPPTLACWRDLPLQRVGEAWECELPLAEVGYFKAKAYALDERGWQHWPDGPDCGVSVQPAWCRTGNTIYCAFPRMFGPSKRAVSTEAPERDAVIRPLDAAGYSVIPPSGRLRDLKRELPHIFDTLGCRILHLLPVNPTPTTYARFGRYGSPYACGDLLAIDPALVEFDKRTTGVDQFLELGDAVHARGGRLFLDIVINHTGWGSTLQENHPEWFRRTPDGAFESPGAWGTVWEDLVELEPHDPALRRHLGDVFLEWCRRGVDGFRCDAGYKVPLPVWQYVTARVRQEFPDTVFLLEGLGGGWDDTANLLTEGGLQWAYSELFQNYDGLQVSGYLDHALGQSEQVGLLVHYSETHDNERLAARGRAWSLLRNRLCALTSVSGGFGFACGVEWLAPERINVHSSRGLAWGNPDNLVTELAQLNRLLADHPCFFDGAVLTRLSAPGAPVYALERRSAAGADRVLVLANTDLRQPQPVALDARGLDALGSTGGAGPVDLLGGAAPAMRRRGDRVELTLAPAAVHCLAAREQPAGVAGEEYRRRKAHEALALAALSHWVPIERLHGLQLAPLGEWLAADPAGFLSATTHLPDEDANLPLEAALREAAARFPRAVWWRRDDARRVVLLPPQHWLLVMDEAPFRATWTPQGGNSSHPGGASLPAGNELRPRHAVSVPVAGGHLACFVAEPAAEGAVLRLERATEEGHALTGLVRFTREPDGAPRSAVPERDARVLLTNGRGGMARLVVDLGRITSKYDCLLGANLHPHLPVDRHIFAKRVRVWINADGFISPLNADNLAGCESGPPAGWRFLAHAGDGRTVAVEIRAAMVPDRNTTVLQFTRLPNGADEGRALPPETDVRLTVRLDLEDRNFHAETKRNGGAEHHFSTHCRPLTPAEAGPGAAGFCFAPAADRQLRVRVDAGEYHPQPEWAENIPHPVEQSRGQVGAGDAYSPGWFEIPLAAGAVVTLTLSADLEPPAADEVARAVRSTADADAGALATTDPFAARLVRAARDFVVRRDDARTVIAGYPWFLDWGRDTLIAARGLLAAGLRDEVQRLLQVFGRYEAGGTLPNTIHGADVSNRDTSDAPLWYGVVCEEWARGEEELLRATVVEPGGRTLLEVLQAIATGYARGTTNGIRMDPASALIWSPSHFTWMDTNYPAGTPREGYPVEIQALWIRLLELLARWKAPAPGEAWSELAARARASFEPRFWVEEGGYYADVLIAGRGRAAASAVPQRALRSNALLPVALGLVTGERARRTVAAARDHLVIPGALRSLAPLPVDPPLPVHTADGRLLNDPRHPYWGRYEGDEDTRRKPAYHNGTGWVWTFPSFCEALVRAWDWQPAAVAAARAYLGSTARRLDTGCLGHLPEVVDGDAPHQERGCDAQAWSATEVLRVWRLLAGPKAP